MDRVPFDQRRADNGEPFHHPDFKPKDHPIYFVGHTNDGKVVGQWQSGLGWMAAPFKTERLYMQKPTP